MINRIKICIFLLTITLLFSCKKSTEKTCFKGNGKIITEIRVIKSFNVLKIYNNFQLTLVQDSVNEIKIRSGKNLIPFIKTESIGDTLKIENKNKCKWLRSYKIPMEIELHFIDLNKIDLYGNSDIFCVDTIKTDSLFIENTSSISSINLKINCLDFIFKAHACTGDFNFSGKTKDVYLYFSGRGNLDTRNLESSYCDITSITINDCFVNCKENLVVSLKSSGNIYYKGNTNKVTVVKQLSTGRLIEMD